MSYSLSLVKHSRQDVKRSFLLFREKSSNKCFYPFKFLWLCDEYSGCNTFRHQYYNIGTSQFDI